MDDVSSDERYGFGPKTLERVNPHGTAQECWVHIWRQSEMEHRQQAIWHETYFFPIHSHSSSHLICVRSEAHLTNSMHFRSGPLSTPFQFNALRVRSSKHTFPNQCFSDPFLMAHLAYSMIFGSGAQRYLSNPSAGPPVILPFFLESSTSTSHHFSELSHPAILPCTMWEYSP